MNFSMISTRKKKKRFKNTAQVDERYLGPEPFQMEFKENDPLLGKAYNWYNYFFTAKDGRKWLEEYVAETRGKEVSRVLKKVDDKYIKTTSCWIAKMLLDQECSFPEASMNYLNDRIEYSLSKVNEKVEQDETEQKPVVQNKISPFTRTLNKAKALMENLEEEIDKAIVNGFESDFSMYTFIQADSNPQFINMATNYIKGVLEELLTYPEDFSAKTYKKQVAFYDGIYQDLTRQKENKKVIRKPRAKKIVSQENVVKNFKYCEKHDPLKLVSIPPESIIGSQQVWFFNKKYNTIGCINAKDERGLQIKGTSIVDYNPETSEVKKARKPEETLKEFFEQGRVGLRKFLLTLKTAQYKINSGRSNEDMVFLKAIK